MEASPRIAVVVPSYRVRAHILEVLAGMPDCAWRVFVVDDACPDGSGALVEAACRDARVQVLHHSENRGVGGAVLTGYRAALEAGATVIVKIDGDGQMDPALLPAFVEPILRGEADYTKGNRFFDLGNLRAMPVERIVGNAIVSFMAKLSTGYWDLFDPTNGYTAIHADVARRLPAGRISQRYFFESDLLFRLGTLRAAVVDVPMDARYGGETSNLHIRQVLGPFLAGHLRNFGKRIFYNYFLRDLSIASLELVAGAVLMAGGLAWGAWQWLDAVRGGEPASAGTVMLAALPVILGLQFLLGFLSYDIASVPRRAIHRGHSRSAGRGASAAATR